MAREEELNLRDSRIRERMKELELKEKEVKEGFLVCKRELEEKKKELTDSRLGHLVSLEKRLNEQCEELRVRAKEMVEEREVLDLKEKELNERSELVELMKREVQERCGTLELKKKEIRNGLEALDEKENEFERKLEVTDKDVDMCVWAVTKKEREVNEDARALELKERKMRESAQALELKERKMRESARALELKERKIDERCKEMNGRFRELELQEKQVTESRQGLELIEKKVDERFRAIELKEKELSEGFQVLETKGKQSDESHEGLELVEQELDERFRALELKEKELSEGIKALELSKKQLNERFRALEPKEKHIDKRCQKLGLKEKEVSEQFREAELKGMQLNEKYREIELKEKEIIDRYEAMEVKEKQIRRRHRALDLREEKINEFFQVQKSEHKQNSENFASMELTDKQMNQSREEKQFVEKQSSGTSIELAKGKNGSFTSGQIETKEPLPETLTSSVASSSIRLSDDINLLCKNMDMKGVRSYIIQHVKEYDMLEDKNYEIFDSLCLASDPAKLVLDVIQSFYELELEKVPVKDFATGCIYLLVQLMKLRVDISSHVRDEARQFADVWKLKLKQDDTPFENFGFLQFLASYKLAEFYLADDLLSLFVTLFDHREVYQPENISSLCYALGLTGKISDLVRSLVMRDKQLQAVRCVCALKMEDVYPIAPLLETHLENIHKRAGKILKSGSRTSQEDACDMELNALKEVVNCISYFKLDSQASIELCIKELEEKRNKRKISEHSSTIKKCSELENTRVEEIKTNTSGLPSNSHTEKKRPAVSRESTEQEKRPRPFAHHRLPPQNPVLLRQPANIWPNGFPVWLHQYPPVTWHNHPYGVFDAMYGVPHSTRANGFEGRVIYPVGAPTSVYNARSRTLTAARGSDSIAAQPNFNRR